MKADFSVPTRQEQWAELESVTLDLLVIGGGATGCGVALDAASRGLRVALVERGDFASQTSSHSTKLAHGGVRYLEAAIKQLSWEQFKLVREGLEERSYLLHHAPHLAYRLKLVTPVYSWLTGLYLWFGLKLYDWISGDRSIGPSKYMSAEEVRRWIPEIRKDGLCGGISYFDGQFNDARMALSLMLTARQIGALTLNYAEVTALHKSEGRLAGALVKDTLTGNGIDVRAKAVVNATGALSDVMRAFDDPQVAPIMQPSKGTHVVIDKQLVPEVGMLIPKTSDGRVAFALPWEGRCLAGTTDHPENAQFSPHSHEDDVEYILSCLQGYFETTIERSDVVAVWSGLRPLVRRQSSQSTSKLPRAHLIETSSSGLLTVTGGKWTSYRKMAEETVDLAIEIHGLNALRECQTRHLVLDGGKGFGAEVSASLQSRYGLDQDVAKHLAEAYGTKAVLVAQLAQEGLDARLSSSHPYIEAEVVYATRHEQAMKPDDVLCRRTRLSCVDQQAAFDALPRVVALQGRELDWSAETSALRLAEAKEEILVRYATQPM